MGKTLGIMQYILKQYVDIAYSSTDSSTMYVSEEWAFVEPYVDSTTHFCYDRYGHKAD